MAKLPGNFIFMRFLKRSSKAVAFTLLEVMIAVAILGLVGLSIFRFVEGTLAGVASGTEMVEEASFLEGFGTFLTTQMEHLPVRLGAITGDPHRFNSVSADELRWIASPGPGMLTRFANGEYTVALTTRQVPGGGFEIGLNRQDVDAREEARWYPLFGEVYGFEVRYFDAARQEWVDRWSDLANRPTLVRVKLWREPEGEPHEWLLPIPYVSSDALVPQYRFNRRRNRSRGAGGTNRPGERGERSPGSDHGDRNGDRAGRGDRGRQGTPAPRRTPPGGGAPHPAPAPTGRSIP